MLPNFFFISLLLSSLIFTTHSHWQCVEQQKRLLLQLKDELIFNSSLSTKLVQWNERDDECCKWYGVDCDVAGNVVSLQLDNETISGGIGDSSSLFKLEYLEKLNLAYNRFNLTKIPRGINNLTYLTHLNLSSAHFGGQLPAEISSLTRLVSLDISNNWAPGNLSLYLDLEMLVQNLTGLRELYLDSVNISSSDERRKWSHIISSYLPNLTSLSLSYCDLSGPLSNSFPQLHSLSTLKLDGNDLSTVVPADLFSNFPSLSTLSLHDCRLKGPIRSTFDNLTKLIELDLSNNLFVGPLPSTLFEGLSNLVYLSLWGNSFSGNIPHSLFSLCSLVRLRLGYNQFNGTFQLDKFQSLANLEHLDLSYNNLSVDDSNVTYRLPQLRRLDLASCNLSDFPEFINHSVITHLDLSNNRIVGEVPSWIWGRQLIYLDLSFNLLTELQKPYHIPASLGLLYLYSNKLRGELHLPIPPASQLQRLSFANNSLSGSIPTSLCSATYLKLLDLSYNKFSGSFPDNFSDHCSLESFDLSNNALEGKIPIYLQSCGSLKLMNVGKNNINDSFPCMLSPTLCILILHSNSFHGEVTCHKSWPSLQILDISSNFFCASLESINFSSWTAMVLGTDAQLFWSSFVLNGGFYRLFTSSIKLMVKGLDLEYQGIWQNFSTIDFSCNNFRGEIPNAIGDLSTVHLLNLSGNELNGSIPKSFGQLSNLESLDLSRNQLTGRIPGELGGLTFLSFLNLSYNKLAGEIPNSRQLHTFSADSFKGNPGLCGLINLNKSCKNHIDDSDVSPTEHENVEEKGEVEWEYVSVSLGLVVGLGSIVWLLLFCRSFRDRYFDKIEEIAEEILDRRKRRRRNARRLVNHRGRRK